MVRPWLACAGGPLQPVQLRVPRRPVPRVPRAARRRALLPRRRPRLLGAVALRRRRPCAARSRHVLLPVRHHARSEQPAADDADDRPSRPHRVAPAGEPRVHAAPRRRPRTGIRALSTSYLDALPRTVGARPHRRLRRDAPDGRDLQAPRRARRRPGTAPQVERRAAAPRGRRDGRHARGHRRRVPALQVLLRVRGRPPAAIPAPTISPPRWSRPRATASTSPTSRSSASSSS